MPAVSPPRDVHVVVPATAANLGAGFDVIAMALKLHLHLDMWRGSPGAEEAVFTDDSAAAFAAAGVEMASGRFELLGEAMQDRLHQPYRLPSLPGAAGALEAAQSADAKGVALSGSGPCVLALCDRHDGNADAVAQAMKAAFQAAGAFVECRILEPENRGAQVHRTNR